MTAPDDKRHFELYPDASSVFETEVSRHRKHLLPLISIDTKFIDASWPSKLHIVSPKESYDGRVGEYCLEYNNAYCKDDILAFSVSADGKYKFLADFRYFLMERGVPSGNLKDRHPWWGEASWLDYLKELTAHYEKVERNYAESKNHFFSTGHLNPKPTDRFDRDDKWITISNNHTGYNAQEIKQSPSSHELCYVAHLQAFSYYDSAPTRLHLYFEPIERIAIIQLDHD